jgi:putative transposase
MNLMLINVSTRRFGRAVRLPEGDIAATTGSGVSKSAVSRRFVALSAARMSEWMAADLSQLDLLAIQIDGMHVTSELTLLAAIGIDGEGAKHPLGLLEGATENAAVVQALLDNLIERGLDTKVCRQAVHRRWFEGADQGDPPHVRPSHTDPTLPGPQGAQHRRAAAQASARPGARGTAPGLGTGRRREGRAADPQSGAPAGTGGARRRGQHPRRAR